MMVILSLPVIPFGSLKGCQDVLSCELIYKVKDLSGNFGMDGKLTGASPQGVTRPFDNGE